VTPHLISIGWLDPGDHYRKIGFIISLGAIMGAAMLDVGLILLQACGDFGRRARRRRNPRRLETGQHGAPLVAWVVFWGAGTVVMGSQVLHQPVLFLLVAIGLCFVFVLVNGIALGISDFNPISSAFVMSVFIMAAIGLRDPGVGLLCAAILAIATAEGGDMQQDRSTGWRLGTNRTVQFRYQVIGIAMGAVLAVVLARLFMHAYPILNQDQFAHKNLPGAEHWQSAFTYKMVGALRGIVEYKPRTMKALCLGILIGLLMEMTRKLIKNGRRFKEFVAETRAGRIVSFLLDAVFLPSPYAFAFGGFVELVSVYWWAAGGVVASLYEMAEARFFRAPKVRRGRVALGHEHDVARGRRIDRRRRAGRAGRRAVWLNPSHVMTK
jgi:MFS family permease